MKKKILMAMFAAMMTCTVTTPAITANAAELPAAGTEAQVVKQELNADVVAQVFDAEYYANTNQDVVDALGNDPAVLLAHYMNDGIYEGRDASATFNATIYAAANTDLKEFYGDDFEGYIEHYLVYGKNEGRIASNDALAKIGAKFTPAISGGSSSSSSGSNNGTSSGSDEVSSDGYMTLYDLDGNPSRVFVGGVTASGEIMRPNGTSVALGEFFDLSESVGAEAGTVTGVYVGSENNYHLEVGIKEGSDTSWSHVESSGWENDTMEWD